MSYLSALGKWDVLIGVSMAVRKALGNFPWEAHSSDRLLGLIRIVREGLSRHFPIVTGLPPLVAASFFRWPVARSK